MNKSFLAAVLCCITFNLSADTPLKEADTVVALHRAEQIAQQQAQRRQGVLEHFEKARAHVASLEGCPLYDKSFLNALITSHIEVIEGASDSDLSRLTRIATMLAGLPTDAESLGAKVTLIKQWNEALSSRSTTLTTLEKQLGIAQPWTEWLMQGKRPLGALGITALALAISALPRFAKGDSSQSTGNNKSDEQKRLEEDKKVAHEKAYDKALDGVAEKTTKDVLTQLDAEAAAREMHEKLVAKAIDKAVEVKTKADEERLRKEKEAKEAKNKAAASVGSPQKIDTGSNGDAPTTMIARTLRGIMTPKKNPSEAGQAATQPVEPSVTPEKQAKMPDQRVKTPPQKFQQQKARVSYSNMGTLQLVGAAGGIVAKSISKPSALPNSVGEVDKLKTEAQEGKWGAFRRFYEQPLLQIEWLDEIGVPEGHYENSYLHELLSKIANVYEFEWLNKDVQMKIVKMVTANMFGAYHFMKFALKIDVANKIIDLMGEAGREKIFHMKDINACKQELTRMRGVSHEPLQEQANKPGIEEVD